MQAGDAGSAGVGRARGWAIAKGGGVELGRALNAGRVLDYLDWLGRGRRMERAGPFRFDGLKREKGNWAGFWDWAGMLGFVMGFPFLFPISFFQTPLKPN